MRQNPLTSWHFPDQQAGRERLAFITGWGLATVIALIVGVTLAVRWPFAEPMQSQFLHAAACVLTGLLVFLIFAPWAQLRRQQRQRALVRELANRLERVRAGRESDSLSTLLHLSDDDLGRLGRAIHDALVEVSHARREAEMLHRTLDDRVRRETTRASAHLVRQANTDALTGLGNRRSLEAWIDEHLRQRGSARCDMVAMVIDVDLFKEVNDKLGHDVGDACLRHLGHVVRSNVPPPGHPIRLGGDEFVVLLPKVSLQEGEALARRLAAFFGQMPWTYESVTRPTLSIGIATGSSAAHDDIYALMRQADEALYNAKRAGRATFGVHQTVAA